MNKLGVGHFRFRFQGWTVEWLWCFIVCSCVVVCIPARSNPATNAAPLNAVLITLQGQIEVYRSSDTAWQPGQTNQPLRVGDRLRTGVHSRATIRLTDLTVLRVNELTSLQISAPQQAGRQSLIDVNSGSAFFFGRDRSAEQEFRTPSTSAAIRGTEFHLAVAKNGRTEVALLDGLVTLSNELGQVDLTSGEMGTVEPGQTPVKTAMLDAANIIQWCLYYPGVVAEDDLDLSADERRALASSLAAYRSGDLLARLQPAQ